MRLMFIGGSHPRHLFYANMVHDTWPFDVAVVQKRGSMMPTAPVHISPRDQKNFRRHFENRATVEQALFGEPEMPSCKVAVVDNVNHYNTVKLVKMYNPDVVLVFGCGMIRPPLSDALPLDTINLHLGLSPRYRGAATLFWPFYNLEPNWAGCTFHRIVQEPDAGAIIHQCRPNLYPDDTIHEVSARAVVKASYDMLKLLDLRLKRGCWQVHHQKNTGKCYLESDFQPQHLRMIYDVYNDDIARWYLDGDLRPTEPKLKRPNI